MVGEIGQPLWNGYEPDHGTAMTNALRWINQYWDQLEDGPNVNYEPIDTSSLNENP